ncbi:MAG TPA: TonB-dependent receptor [Bacteroidales bacterium]|jgi:hemoglobin/transferrin/lactoferrin receptor protein|nr:TonB-dependent receptor [Bacteroidales bacterium]MDI9533054.1 TonB-dependent receptor [Bacteroidota bacterium]MZQ80242.1 TonB-dependent receptor [Bacteroidales bacterium]HHU98642.1 TonB-dependent receptor [Bacteroidales bacterium]HNV67024.1 TonB-dependent receptor [Bacteroidales bacterium]
MNKLTFLLLFLAPLINLGAQTVTVLSADDSKPIADVAVYNEARTVFGYTNYSGKVSLSEFTGGEPVFFQHFSYERVSFTIEELEAAQWVVKLETKTFEVEEFIISANRWEQKSEEVPNNINVVALSAVKIMNPQTAADLISMGDVFVQKSQLGGGSPMIRGFATNRVLINIDGVRMNNAIYREGNIQNIISIDPNIIERTEIIFGPGATMYGSDALGGVMDFHTRRALFSTGDSILIKAEAMARWSSASDEQTYHAWINAGGRKVAFLSSVTWSDFGDLKMGSVSHPEYLRDIYQKRVGNRDSVFMNSNPRKQVASGYKQINTTNKLRFKAGKHLDIDLAHHYSRLSDVPRYDRLIQVRSGTLRFGDWYYGPQVWMMTNASVRYNRPTTLFDEIRLTVARQDYRESRHDRALNKTTLNEQFEKVGIWSANLDFDKKSGKRDNLAYYGAEYVWNTIHSTADVKNIVTGETEPAGSRYPNGKNIYNSISLYGGYKFNLSSRFTLSTGARYNYVSLNSEIADNSWYNFPFTSINSGNDALTGAAGAVYRPDDRTELTVNLSTGFRAPNLDDLGKVFESAPGVLVVPNPDLKPEYLYNIDLGASRKFGKTLLAEASLFWSYLDNAMVRREFLFNGQPTFIFQGEESQVYAMVNAGHAIVYGTQLKAELRPSSFIRVKSSLSLIAGHDDEKAPLRHVPPLFGATHVVFERSALKADLYALYNGSITNERMAPSEKDKPYLYARDENGNPWSPGWFTLNFKTSYNINNRLDLTAGIENLLDLRYRPYSSGISAPGRNFIIAARIKI